MDNLEHLIMDLKESLEREIHGLKDEMRGGFAQIIRGSTPRPCAAIARPPCCS